MFTYRIATTKDLEQLWDYDINRHSGEERKKWANWKREYLGYNERGESTTFVAVCEDEPVGQITLLFSTNCSAVKGHRELCDGKTTANMNSFRIKQEFENQGHISKLVKLAEQFAKDKGIEYLTIGSEAKESRNLAIYLHFGYTQFITGIYEGNDLILYYGKKI